MSDKKPEYLKVNKRKEDLSLMDTFMLGFTPVHLRAKALEKARKKKKGNG